MALYLIYTSKSPLSAHQEKRTDKPQPRLSDPSSCELQLISHTRCDNPSPGINRDNLRLKRSKPTDEPDPGILSLAKNPWFCPQAVGSNRFSCLWTQCTSKVTLSPKPTTDISVSVTDFFCGSLFFLCLFQLSTSDFYTPSLGPAALS